MSSKTTKLPNRSESADYQIAVNGRLKGSWREWFGDMEIATEMKGDGSQVTTLSGQINDQSELRGLLNKLWDLNLVLVSLQKYVEVDDHEKNK